ncbi:unnamed protein product [Adineta ricciae]|uniref:Uncharacterized protein n=1 Tax=Adineta ricciae TaxID=249248 RepID=A0A815M4G1_ADIRI|nr:unnamed protein product [Adineta ricciae]CAF1419019.1 unnamed protein product [Adineta ricciae]
MLKDNDFYNMEDFLTMVRHDRIRINLRDQKHNYNIRISQDDLSSCHSQNEVGRSAVCDSIVRVPYVKFEEHRDRSLSGSRRSNNTLIPPAMTISRYKPTTVPSRLATEWTSLSAFSDDLRLAISENDCSDSGDERLFNSPMNVNNYSPLLAVQHTAQTNTNSLEYIHLDHLYRTSLSNDDDQTMTPQR